MVNLDGIMVRYIKDNGKMGWRMDMGCGDRWKVIDIRDNGGRIGRMGRGYIIIMAINIMGILRIFWSREEGNKSFRMGINM